MKTEYVMVPVAVLADIEAHKNATVSQFMGANHMALVLAQKINEWADIIAAAPKPSAEPVGYGLLGRKSRTWDGETFVKKSDAGGYDSDALLPLYAAQQPAVNVPSHPNGIYDGTACDHDDNFRAMASKWMAGNLPEAQYSHLISLLWSEYVTICNAAKPPAVEAQEQPAPVPSCEWHEDEDGIWETSCGQSWMFPEGGPEDNDMKFCHQCGKHLIARPQNPEAGHD